MRILRSFAPAFSLCFAFALVLFAGAVQTPSARAYALNGKYWPNNYAIRYVKDSMTSKDSTGFDNARAAWNNSSAPVFFCAGCSGNYVEMYDQNDGNDGTDGFSYEYTSSTGCNANGTTVYIITGAGAYLNTYYTNQSSYTSGGAIQSVAAHELGHVVGLAHVSNEHELMYPTTDRWFVDGINTPQSDDINGTKAIYTPC